ncbi:MAG TPA: class II aldolase/adducin family protein [Anaerolineaceae bacterium]|jgi:ribulose-5-phosphate 4-epimerase/fuculose-1-phosphate aldolase|nr:class II aldolase/adducin family protein [Anaerolineaceae bacterium]
MLKRLQRAMWKVVDLVNSPRKTQKITRSAVASRVIFERYLAAARVVDAKRFCAGSLAEMSMRVGGGKLMINAPDIPFGLLDVEALLFTGIEQQPHDQELMLPKHTAWHQQIYRYSAATTVLLCQPHFLMVLTNRNQLPPKGILSDADALIERVKLIPASYIDGEWVEDSNEIWLVPSVGVLSAGQTLEQNIDRVEILESVCAMAVLKSLIA